MKNDSINVRVTEETKKELIENAEKENRSLSNYIQYILNKFLKNKEG